MLMEKTVLVTGATGTIGRDLIKILSENGVPVRAGVRDQAKARKQFGADIALATFDFEDAASFRCTRHRSSRRRGTDKRGPRWKNVHADRPGGARNRRSSVDPFRSDRSRDQLRRRAGVRRTRRNASSRTAAVAGGRVNGTTRG